MAFLFYEPIFIPFSPNLLIFLQKRNILHSMFKYFKNLFYFIAMFLFN